MAHGIPLSGHHSLYEQLNHLSPHLSRSLAQSLFQPFRLLVGWQTPSAAALKESIALSLSRRQHSSGERPLMESKASIPGVPEPVESSSSFGTATIVSTFSRTPVGTRKALKIEYRPVTPPPPGDRVTRREERCIICLSETKFLPDKAPTSSCTHLSQVCRPCLARTIQSVVQNGDVVGGMRCPTPTCRALLTYTDVQTWTEDSEDVEAGLLERSVEKGSRV